MTKNITLSGIILIFILLSQLNYVFGSNNQPINKQACDELFQVKKLAIVDIESILKHASAPVKVRDSINILSRKIQDELSAKETELKKLEAELVTKRDNLSKKDFEILIDNFNKEVNLAQKKMHDRKIIIEKMHSTAIMTIQKTINDIISQLAQKYEIQLVLPSSQILFAHKNLNLTNEVINKLNKLLPEIILTETE